MANAVDWFFKFFLKVEKNSLLLFPHNLRNAVCNVDLFLQNGYRGDASVVSIIYRAT